LEVCSLNRIHVSVASVIVGLAAIFGLAATTKTAGIGASKPETSRVSGGTIAARQHKLDRAQAALRTARAQRPPALPPVPSAPRTQLVAQPAPAPAPVAGSGSSSSSDEDEREYEGDDD
jgi:hypothetical protein